MDGQTFFQTILQNKNAPIQFSGSDETNSFPVKGSEVTIVGSSGDHDVGSSKLHIKNIVNFGWEHKYYPGELVSHHISGIYIAYAILTPGKNLGVVRVVNRQTDERTLIKGMKGAVVDVSFAHVKEDVVVGCVDELGNLFIYRITEDSSGLLQERVLEVIRDKPPHTEHRLIWCPYLKIEDEEDNKEEEDEEENSARLLVLTHGEECEVWHVDTVVEEHGTGPLRPEDVTEGLLKISEAGGIVTDAAFSPDGTALATASKDGQVKFFQVYMKGDGEPRCLHQWSPHQGSPVSSLLFLDDHSEYKPGVPFWKYAVTGSKFNSELKIWSCETWSCLQTISFEDSDDATVRLKIALDSTARYLLLSDIDRNLLYVLTLSVSTESPKEVAEVISVSEFPTPSSFLSVTCMSAGRKQVSMGESGMTVAEESETEQQVSEDSKEATVLKICLVQPKSLQECSIIFSDAALASLPPVETFLPPPSSVMPAPPPSSALPPPPALLAADIKTEHLSPKSSAPIIASSPMEKSMSNKDDVSDGLRANEDHGDASRTRSNDDLADAASKISLLSSNSFKPLLPTISSQDIKDEESSIEAEDEPENEDDSEYDDGSVPMLQSVNMIDERDIVSGNSSPSREVATILSVDERRFKEENDTTLKESPSPDYTATTNYSSANHNTSGASANYSSVNLNSSGTIFPDPPAINSSTLQPTIQPSSAEGSSSSCLEALVRELQGEVKALRQEVSVHRTEQISKQVELNLAARLEGTFTRSLTAAMANLEKSMKQQEEKIMDYTAKSITKKCDQILSMELKRNVAETVNRSLEPLKTRIDSQIAQKLTNADQIVRESVLKMVSNPGFQESISKSVAQTLQPAIAQSYKEMLGANLPGVERMMKQVLSNVNETFIAGTREYETALRGRLEASEVSQRDEISPYLRDLMRSVGNMTAAQNKLSNQLTELNNRLDTEIPTTVAEIVKQEIRVLDKTASSPQLRTTDIKEIIQGLVSSGRLNEAFQTALSANDLGLVMFTCELVNTTQIFSQSTCPLSQSVLLSLIQQLSVDLQDKTEVKFQFLEEAIIHLDKSDNVTKTHIGSVFMTLQKSVQAYTQSNANNRYSRNFKTLMMAANGILAEIR